MTMRDGGGETARVEKAILAQQVAALGAHWSPAVLAATNAIYEHAVEITDPSVECVADLSYGEHPRQKLDVYVPRAHASHVLVFLPGGGFTGGGKDEHPSFYRNVGVYFAKRGALTFIANYRLAPEFRWAAQTSDVGAAVEWAAANAPRFGGAANHVHVIGHSAGAVNLAGYLLHPEYDGRAGRAGVKHAALISGVYRFSDDAPENVRMYAGDPQEWEDRSPLTHIARCDISLTLCAGELDPAELVRPTLEFAGAYASAKGHSPPLYVLAGHNHVSSVRSIGSTDDTAGLVLSSILT